MQNRKLSRRHFLRAAGGAALAFPIIIPATSLGRGGAVAPSNRITLGVIGCGGKGMSGMANFLALDDAQIVALCDVNSQNLAHAAARAKLDAKTAGYRDFRQLLARPDIDAVLIASPDHWHVLLSIAAAKAGKDVYCEKPMSNTIAEGRALVNVINRYGTVFQHGTQLKSTLGTRLACELVRNGRIGKLKGIRIGSPPGHVVPYQPEMPAPEWLDYDRWLGPAPVAPYTTERCLSRGWYFISDYSKSGWVAGYGVHDMDIAQWGMGLETGAPMEIEGTGVFPTDGMADTVLTYRLEFRYANGITITMTDTGQNPHGVLFEGETGSIFNRGNVLKCNPLHLAHEKFSPGEIHLYASTNHEANFIQCIKTRSRTITPVEVGHRSTSACLLGGIALKLGRKLRWNAETERFINDPEADRLLTYAMRDPWTV